jgi:hypothetical protein
MNFASKAGAKVIKLYYPANVFLRNIQLIIPQLLQHTEIQLQYVIEQNLILRQLTEYGFIYSLTTDFQYLRIILIDKFE